MAKKIDNNISTSKIDILNSKREEKNQVLSKMLKIYCRGNKHVGSSKDTLCESCQSLKNYANHRTSVCPQIEKGLFCSKCPIQCYKQEFREEMRKCMRYSGPRLMFYHPGEVIKHVFQKSQKKK